ncbi:ABC transporter permease subunit [Halovivax cerinus]|uniref:ABC transporter permease subunit n=1 Tax=Halovivax cerinus TaxID=1487865 RepID=A0ABD5NR10_9EURY|nr:ABC transporter permease subunit [Halovivax cerinus]
MSTVAVAKKDVMDGIRSKLLWGLMVLFVLSVGGISWLFAGGETSGAPTDLEVTLLFAISALPAIFFLIPITGLVVSVKSIVRERELGSIKILLSLPHSRFEVLFGKFLGRSLLLTVAILVGFVPGAAILSTQFGTVPGQELAGLTVMTVLFGIVFVAVGIGLSALVTTETRATVGGVIVFILLYTWSGIVTSINGRLDLLSGDALLFVQRFHLFTVFQDTLLALLSIVHDEVPNASSAVLGQRALSNPEGIGTVSEPFYLQHWFAFVILALWIVVPLAIGYWRFERADL